jgi:hypothetical protein
VASKGTLSGVFPDVPSQMLAARKDHSAVAIAPALKGFCGCWPGTTGSTVRGRARGRGRGCSHIGEV